MERSGWDWERGGLGARGTATGPHGNLLDKQHPGYTTSCWLHYILLLRGKNDKTEMYKINQTLFEVF